MREIPESSEARKALANGLKILRILVESDDPLGASEIARRSGMHQSSASRILQTLIAAGYVRKLSYRSFTLDYGVLTLGARAARHFRLAERPRAAIAAIAARNPLIAVVALTALWNGQLIYLLRTAPGVVEPAALALAGYPLHLSSPGLRLLLDMPEETALLWLKESKLRYGWEQPTPQVPANPKTLLNEARERLRHDCLVIDDWQKPGWLAAAIPVKAPNEPACALSISISMSHMSIEEALLVLQQGRRAVEESLA
jgi:DNA-binding IclR family transcriptional regulator